MPESWMVHRFLKMSCHIITYQFYMLAEGLAEITYLVEWKSDGNSVYVHGAYEASSQRSFLLRSKYQVLF